MLREAFNGLTRIHSRAATLKRFGSPDIYSPCRITPSQYFRYIDGPESTVIHQREFIIPVDTMMGQFAQVITFGAVPDDGVFNIRYAGNDTTDIDKDATAASIQTALRLVAGLSLVTVDGDFTTGFSITFIGFQNQPSAISIVNNTMIDAGLDPVAISITQTFTRWTGELLKRSDKVIDSVLGPMTIKEIDEMCDIGGAIMGLRVRVE